MQKIKRISSILIMCTMTIITNAYEFSFFNNTNNEMGIAIQYTGNDTDEPLYKQLVKPKSMVTFTPGKLKIPEIKWGFCLDNVYYAQSPTPAQKEHNFEKASWRKIAITWVEEKSATKRKEKQQSPQQKKAAPAAAKPEKATPAAPAASAQKSLCRDRHFDIIEDEHNKISITSSLNE